MTEPEIFAHLLERTKEIAHSIGPVTSCFVRNGEIIVEGVTDEKSVHSEYALLREIKNAGITIMPDDIVYVTVEPCGKRRPGGLGEQMGDCTTNLLVAGVKRLVYGAQDPDASETTRHKYADAGCEFRQIDDKSIINACAIVFNSTMPTEEDKIPLVS
jgi:pyrimidine deaminase RibD-like protein